MMCSHACLIVAMQFGGFYVNCIFIGSAPDDLGARSTLCFGGSRAFVNRPDGMMWINILNNVPAATIHVRKAAVSPDPVELPQIDHIHS
eukprot:6172898-Amphidinium_carterae.1